MKILTFSQWELFIGYTILVLSSVFLCVTNRRVRPIAFAVGFISLTHAALYFCFIFLPHIGNDFIMWFSVVTRYQVQFVMAATLIFTVWATRTRGKSKDG